MASSAAATASWMDQMPTVMLPSQMQPPPAQSGAAATASAPPSKVDTSWMDAMPAVALPKVSAQPDPAQPTQAGAPSLLQDATSGIVGGFNGLVNVPFDAANYVAHNTGVEMIPPGGRASRAGAPQNMGVAPVSPGPETGILAGPQALQGASKALGASPWANSPEPNTLPGEIAYGAGSMVPFAASQFVPGAGEAEDAGLLAKGAGALKQGVPAAAKMASMGAASGTGQYAGQQLDPNDPQFGGAVGSLVGGGLPIGLGVAAGQASKLLGPVTKAMQEAGAGKILQSAASDPAAVRQSLDAAAAADAQGAPHQAILDDPDATPQAKAQAQAALQAIPGRSQIVAGSAPTTFQLTGDQGLGQLERSVGGGSGGTAPGFVARTGAQNQARVDQIVNQAPASAAPSDVADAFRQHLADLDAQHAAETTVGQQQVAGQMDALGGNLPIGPGSAQTALQQYGTAMRGSLAGNAANAKEAAQALYGLVPQDVRIDMAPVKQAANQIRSAMSQNAAPMAGDEAAIFGTAQMMPRVQPFSDLGALRSRITDAMAAEKEANGSSQSYRRMTQLLGSVDDAMSGSVEQRAAQEAQAVASGQMAPADTMAAQIMPGASRDIGTMSDAAGAETTAVNPSIQSPQGRTPFAADFPNVVIQHPGAPTGVRSHPDYKAAKAGDADAAYRLVRDSLDDNKVEQIRQMIGNQGPVSVAVHGEEASGRNAIPTMYAEALSQRLGIPIEDRILQSNIPARTGSSALHRITTPVKFDGPVGNGTKYLLVDDHISQGGTLADLKSHIERNGGQVLGATTLTGAETAAKLAPSPETVNNLRFKFPGLEQFWEKKFGHGFQSLTQAEADYLLRSNSTDSIRDGIVARTQAPIDQPGSGIARAGRGEGNGEQGLRYFGAGSAAPRLASLEQSYPSSDEELADAREAYKRANKGWADYNQTYTNKSSAPGVAHVLQETARKGEYRVQDSAVPSTLFPPGKGSAERVNAYLKAGGDPAHIKDYLAYSLRSAAENDDGTLKANGLLRWLDQNKETLNAAGLRPQFETVAKAQSSLDEATAARLQARKEFEKSAAGKFLGGSDPVAVVGKILRSDNSEATMRELARRTAGNQAARAGLQRAVVDHIMGDLRSNTFAGVTSERQIKADTFQTFVRKASPALRQIFTAQQVKAIEDVGADIQRSQRSVVGSKIGGGSNTASDIAAGKKHGAGGTHSLVGSLGMLEGLGDIGEHFGHLSGVPLGGVAGKIAGFFGAKLFESMRAHGMEKINDLVAEAMLHPDLARTLLAKAPGGQFNRSIASRAAGQIRALTAAAIGRENNGEGQ